MKLFRPDSVHPSRIGTRSRRPTNVWKSGARWLVSSAMLSSLILAAFAQTLAQTPDSDTDWWQRPMRMMRHDYRVHVDALLKGDLERLARETREVWHCNTEWVMGTLGAPPGLGHVTTFDAPGFDKLKELGELDLLRTYVPIAHANGVRVIAYLNAHWYSPEMAEKHPGWEQVVSSGESTGRVAPLYGTGTTFCPNSPWRDWMYRLIAETGTTGVDGVFLDGPALYPGCCYCETCRRMFSERTGGRIPLEEDWSDPLWREFVAFRQASMVEFMRAARQALQTVNPGAILFINGELWNTPFGCSPGQLEPYQDVTGAEVFFFPGPRVHDLYASLLAAKFLSAGRNPSVVFTHHSLGRWYYTPLPPGEVELAIAQSATGGANPWFGLFDNIPHYNKNEAAAGVADMLRFLEENASVLSGEISQARVALWVSEQTSRYYVSRLPGFLRDTQQPGSDAGTGESSVPDWSGLKSASSGRVDADLMGYFEALSRAHVPVDVLWDGHISTERLENYDVLVLANVACMSESQRAAIRAFVESGGTLIADFESGQYDELGQPASDVGWTEFLGLGQFPRSLASPATSYMRVVADEPVVAGLEVGGLLVSPQYALTVEVLESSRTPAVILEPMPFPYQDIAADSKYPAVVTSQHGTGRVVYFPSLEGEFYYSSRIDQHARLIANAVASARRDRQRVTIEAPSTVHLEVRSAGEGGDLHVHLLNSSGDMQRPISEIIPVHDIRISIGGTPGKVRARSLWLDRELPVSTVGSTAVMVLPEMDVYDVVVVSRK